MRAAMALTPPAVSAWRSVSSSRSALLHGAFEFGATRAGTLHSRRSSCIGGLLAQREQTVAQLRQRHAALDVCVALAVDEIEHLAVDVAVSLAAAGQVFVELAAAHPQP